MDTEIEMLRIAAIGTSGVIAGFYAAFSLVVIPALDRVAPQRASDVMTTINDLAETPPFLSLFAGSAFCAAAMAGVGGWRAEPVTVLGGIAVLAGTVITAGVNVPLNRRLGAGSSWAAYRRPWARANALRTLVSTVGAVLLAAPMLG